jgi:hypothetical protein
MRQRLLRAIFTASALLSTLACQRGKVELQQIAINTEGLSFSGIFAEFKTRTINKFKLTGQCQSDIVKVFYRFDKSQAWQEIPSSKIDCANSSTFTFDFQSDIATIQKASGYKYDAEKRGKYPALDFEFYGRTLEYSTNVVTVSVISLVEPGHQGLTPSGETTLSSVSGNIKIRGKLSADGMNPVATLESTSFKIRNGQLRTHNR